MPEGAFADLAGQDEVVAQLHRAADAAARLLAGEPRAAGGMTHAWLFTGPPGSGRSVAARAFAAALLCPDGGGGPTAIPRSRQAAVRRCARCRAGGTTGTGPG